MCSFCNQHKISGHSAPPTPKQARATVAAALEKLSTSAEIAFFGGSFTAIDRGYMCNLLEAVAPFLSDSRITGIRISTRPDAIDIDTLNILRYYSVTSIELGAQSMDDTVLELNRRGHSARSVETASELIKSFGFSLGLQMMTGLYGSTYEKDIFTGRKLASLMPDTIRIYPTVVLPDTELADLVFNGSYTPPNVDESLPRLVELRRIFLEKGIRIIRLGLHASREVENSMIAGCYHSALGELCMGEEVFEDILQKLEGLDTKTVCLNVSPKKLSVVLGHKRRNIERLSNMGYNVSVVRSDSILGDYTITA